MTPEMEAFRDRLDAWRAMAGNLAVAVAEHVADRGREAPHEVQADRKAVCEACPLFDASSSRCRSCGCYLPIKRAWSSSRCPEGKWGPA